MSVDFGPTTVVNIPIPSGWTGSNNELLHASVVGSDPTATTYLIECGVGCELEAHTLTISAVPTGWSYEDDFETVLKGTIISRNIACDGPAPTAELTCQQALMGVGAAQVAVYNALATDVPVTITAGAAEMGKFVSMKHAGPTTGTYTTPADAFATGAAASSVLAEAASKAAAPRAAATGSGVGTLGLLGVVVGMLVR